MPELEAYYGYPAALGVMAFIAVCLGVYFRRKKWLSFHPQARDPHAQDKRKR